MTRHQTWYVEEGRGLRLASLEEFMDAMKNGPPDGVTFHPLPPVKSLDDGCGGLVIELTGPRARTLLNVVRSAMKDGAFSRGHMFLATRSLEEVTVELIALALEAGITAR